MFVCREWAQGFRGLGPESPVSPTMTGCVSGTHSAQLWAEAAEGKGDCGKELGVVVSSRAWEPDSSRPVMLVKFFDLAEPLFLRL